MIYNLKVETTGGLQIPAAKVTFTRGGVALTTIPVNAASFVMVNDETDGGLLGSDVTVTASAPGFYDSSATGSQLAPDSYFQLQARPNYMVYLVGGGAAALLLAGMAGKKKRVKGFFDNIDPKVKIGLLAAGGLAAYLIFSKDNSGKKLPGAAKTELDQLAQAGILPTITETEAEALSSTLTAAFAGCGTDEYTVYNVFEGLKNKADLLTLIYVYDVRPYQGCFEGMIWEEAVTANLSQALSNELRGSELLHVNSILADNGIDFNF